MADEKFERTWKSFFMGLFSEDDGSPSSSRFLMGFFSVAVVCFLETIVHHIVYIIDPAVLGIWLSNLPLIMGAMVVLVGAPYAINKTSSSLTDIFTSMKKGS